MGLELGGRLGSCEVQTVGSTRRSCEHFCWTNRIPKGHFAGPKTEKGSFEAKERVLLPGRCIERCSLHTVSSVTERR